MATRQRVSGTTIQATGRATTKATKGSGRKTVVVLPLNLAAQIDGQVGARNRQRFVIENCVKELLRLQQMEAIREAAGAWRHEDHPELAEVSSEWRGCPERSQRKAGASAVPCRSGRVAGVHGAWAVAKRAGEMARQRRRKGQTPHLPDLLIAATAIEHGAVLVTANVRDFPMKELQIHPCAV